MAQEEGYYGQERRSFEPTVNDMFLTWVSGSSGAVASYTRKQGITSVVHGATGVYVVTFDAEWYKLLDWSGWVQQASYSKTGACDIRMTANAIATAGTHTVTFLVVDGDGDAVESTTGDILTISFRVQAYQP